MGQVLHRDLLQGWKPWGWQDYGAEARVHNEITLRNLTRYLKNRYVSNVIGTLTDLETLPLAGNASARYSFLDHKCRPLHRCIPWAIIVIATSWP